MINEAWPLRPLGELFAIGAGKTMSAAARGGGDKTPFLRTSNVFWDELDLTVVDEMALASQELEGKLLRPGDLLVCEGGDIGRAAIWNGQLEVMTFQNHLHRLRPLLDDIEPRFYVYFLQSAFTQLGIFAGAGNRTTIPNLSRSRLAALTLPHPSIQEQRDIARALAHVRSALKLHERSAASAEALKRAAMHTLFTRGLRGEPQKETEIGPVPESWKVVKLSDAFDTELGKMLSQKARGGDSPKPYLRNKNVQWGRLDLSDVLTMDFTERESEKFRLRPGDLLICEGGVIGRAALWRGEFAECYYQKALHRVRPRNELASNEFLLCWLSFAFEHQNLYNIGGASSTIAHLPQSLLNELAVPLPSHSEQSELLEIFAALDGKLDLHRRKRAVLEELFQALLHKLMTGEIRVGDLDLAALETGASA